MILVTMPLCQRFIRRYLLLERKQIWRVRIAFLMKTVGIFVACLLSGCIHPQCWAQSTISFCDGDDLFVINGDACSGGVLFGDRKPDCVCLSGVYNSWSEKCEMYDGFADQYCSALWDGDDSSYNVEGLRLLSGVGNIYRDTRVVFSDNGSNYNSWKAYGVGQNRKTRSSTLYTLNGFPVVLSSAKDKFFCVEPSERKEKQVCRYLAKDNGGLWRGGDPVKIVVMADCEVKGYSMSELKPNQCYDIINQNSSECRLSCAGARVVHLAEGGPGGTRKWVEDTPNTFTIGAAEAMVSQSKMVDVAKKIAKNGNFFMHRKLNKYTRLRQVGRVARPDLSHTAPRRTFLLLETAKKIVRDFCPVQFISDIFLDQAVDLFALLHQGLDYTYYEDVAERDFLWIQDNLLQCQREQGSLDREKHMFLGGNGNKFCKNDDIMKEYTVFNGNVSKTFPLEKGQHHYNGRFHFVIDAVWLIIDLVHALCQSAFVESFRMFHVWEQGSEKLFTRQIRTLWYEPNVELTIYSALLSDRAVLDMVNLERCAEGAYKRYENVRELARLPAPKSVFLRRRRRAIRDKQQKSVASSVDVFCAKEGDFAVDC